MSRGPDCGTLLERAILAHAAAAKLSIRIVAATATRWASATFTGARHEILLEAEGDAGVQAWLDRLDDADLPVRGHLVADLAVVRTERTSARLAATLEILTVEDS